MDYKDGYKAALEEAAAYFKYAAAISKDERWPEAAGYEAAAKWCEEKVNGRTEQHQKDSK